MNNEATEYDITQKQGMHKPHFIRLESMFLQI